MAIRLLSDCSAVGVYTPFDELPAETRLLFEYNPKLARQMLADAGCPDSFTGGEILVSTELHSMDIAEMAIAYWADIGVEVTMKVMEWGVWQAAEDAGEYDLITESAETWSPLLVLGGYFIPDNIAFYDNPEFTALYEEAALMRDEAEQNPILKELAVTALDSVAYIPLLVGENMGITAWWPWLRNYYGESTTQCWNPTYAMATLWIDQDVKAEMGY